MTHEEEQARALVVEQEQIGDAARVKEFLADPAVANTLRRIEKQYLDEFRTADTDEKRRNVWAAVKALTDLTSAINGVLASGQLAQHVRNTRTAAEDRNPGRNPRKS